MENENCNNFFESHFLPFVSHHSFGNCCVFPSISPWFYSIYYTCVLCWIMYIHFIRCFSYITIGNIHLVDSIDVVPIVDSSTFTLANKKFYEIYKR